MTTPMTSATTIHPAPDHVILGLGVSGLSCARFLQRQGLRFAVTDSRAEPPNARVFKQEFAAIPMSLGRFDESFIAHCRQLIVSPGIAVQEPYVQQAKARGAEIVGDIELFARAATAPVVAITGANGKSTVTTLVGEMARHSGKRVGVGGNLGTAALDLITSPEPELYVLELSSFQLETTMSLDATAAVVLNITPDHMDRYATVADYCTAKYRIYRGTGTTILNADDPLVMAMRIPGRQQMTFTLSAPVADDQFGVWSDRDSEWLGYGRQRLLAVDELKIQGRHNIANALASLALGTAIGLPMPAMLAALCEFGGLPHRCQWVARVDSVDWFNDSKGTNVGATCAAIQGLAARRQLVLIGGGDGKGADFSPLAEAVRGTTRAVIVIGRDGPLIEAAVQNDTTVMRAADMDAAVVLAAELAQAGDAVLLSPACASFDMFRNYGHRGEVFIDAVHKLRGQAP